MNSQPVDWLLLSLCHLVIYGLLGVCDGTEVVDIPILGWLLTLGLIALIFLISFFALLSRLSLARRTAAELWCVTLMHILIYLVLLHPVCQLPPPPFPVQEVWNTLVGAHGVSADRKVATIT